MYTLARAGCERFGRPSYARRYAIREADSRPPLPDPADPTRPRRVAQAVPGLEPDSFRRCTPFRRETRPHAMKGSAGNLRTPLPSTARRARD
jgi:hypothetical protein